MKNHQDTTPPLETSPFSKLKETVSNFSPAPYLTNKHVQTLIGTRPLMRPHVRPSKFYVQCDESVMMSGLLYTTRASKLVIVYHGLAGRNDSLYMRYITAQLLKMGYDVAAMSLPGNQDPSPYVYHAGDHAFFDQIVAYFKSSYDKLFCVGFSLSGNMVLRWLSQKRDITAAMAVSPVINLNRSSTILDDPKNVVYQRYFLWSLIHLYKKKRARYPTLFDPFKEVLKVSSVRDFDAALTCPFHGYDHIEDYYTENSSASHLTNIQNPTGLLYATDDPFLDAQDYTSISLPDNHPVQVLNAPYGGHVSFFDSFGKGYQYPHWIHRYFSQFDA